MVQVFVDAITSNTHAHMVSYMHPRRSKRGVHITQDADRAPRSIHASEAGATTPLRRMSARHHAGHQRDAAGSTLNGTEADTEAHFTMKACMAVVLATPK